MKHWLITGGAGFIGTNFVRYVAERELATLTVLDKLTYAGSRSNIQTLVDAGTIRFVEGDICDEGLVATLFATTPIDAVVHMAAESHVDRSIAEPHSFIQTNVLGTYHLLEAAREHWTANGDRHLFLHVSTDEVYGSLTAGDSPFTYDSPHRPNSPYSASKASADHLVRAWARTYGVPTAITHCSNNYGPWQWPEKLIPLIISNAIADQPLPIYGDGSQIRDWIHVLDHCDALLAVLQQGRRGETYLVGANNELSNLALVHEICRHVDERLGRTAGTSARLITHVDDRPGHDIRYAIDAQKAERELNWRPTRSFDAGLREVVAWYVDHQTWSNARRQSA
ncbi:MAG: dTDP-glucose 4,6-dehydratase [Pseudomonadota bacterium]